MDDKHEELVKQVNLDIIFFFLTVVDAIISFYLINEKKKSIYKRNSISKEEADTIYRYSRILNLIICIYFLINAYYSYATEEDLTNKKQNELLLAAAFFAFISSLLYLPLGNSNIIIEN